MVNGLLTRIAILCSGIIIFPIISCGRLITNENFSNLVISSIYRATPHIGGESAHLDRRRLSKFDLVFSFLCCLIVFYFMYGAAYFVWTQMFFNSSGGSYSEGLNDLYFFYVNLIEFMSLLFIRTRSSIKYLPKYIILLNLMFLFYFNSYFYAA